MLCKGEYGEVEEEDKTAGGVFSLIELSVSLLSITVALTYFKTNKNKNAIQ